MKTRQLERVRFGAMTAAFLLAASALLTPGGGPGGCAETKYPLHHG
jgi:hypothetical protein